MIVVFKERFLWSLPQEAALEILMFFDWKTMRGHDYEIVIDGSQVGRSMKIEIDQTRSGGCGPQKSRDVVSIKKNYSLLWNEKQGTALSEDQSNRIELVEYHSPHWFRV